VRANSEITDDMWKSIEYFYELRCNIYHELSSPEITESDFDSFRELVASVLHELHGIIV